MFSTGADEDVAKCFFLFEYVKMRGKYVGDLPAELMCHLFGEAFEFFYESVDRNSALMEAATDYQGVRN